MEQRNHPSDRDRHAVKREGFFKNHWLGIFLSSILAGIVSTFIYEHWSSKALFDLFEGRDSSASPTVMSPAPAETPPPASIRQSDQARRDEKSPPAQLTPPPSSSISSQTLRSFSPSASGGWEDLELVPVGVTGQFPQYIPSRRLRTSPRVLTPSALIEGLEYAGFRGAAGESQWPQWRTTADVINEFSVPETAGPRVVMDRESRLDWYVDSSGGDLSWDQAARFVRRLNNERPLGLAGWRLPTTEELATILEPEPRAGLYNRRTGQRNDSFCIDRVLQPESVIRDSNFGRYWSADLKSDNWVWTLETSSGCGFHKWGRIYGANVLAVRTH
jgi:hypothetical protein